MKFIEAAHPEGGRVAVSVRHISSVNYKPSPGGGIKSRLAIDLDNGELDVVLLGEEADRVWALIQPLTL